MKWRDSYSKRINLNRTTIHSDAQTKIVEAIKKTESRNSKLHELLTEALTVLRGEKYIKVRWEIYDLLEAVSQHIKVKIERRLAGMMDSDKYSSDDKLRIIGILKHGRLIDVLTIQRLSEGLLDSSSEVRGATAEAMGDILLIPANPNFLKGIYNKVYPLLVHPAKNLFDKQDTVKNIRHYITGKLTHVVENDPDFFVKTEAMKAIIKIHDGYTLSDRYHLIQELPSENDPLSGEDIANEELKIEDTENFDLQ